MQKLHRSVFAGSLEANSRCSRDYKLNWWYISYQISILVPALVLSLDESTVRSHA